MPEREEGERQGQRSGHILDADIGRTGENLVVGNKLRLGEVDGKMRMGVVAGGVLTAAEVHHRIVDFLNLVAVQVAIALLRYDTVNDAFSAVVVVGQSVGVVL